MSEHIKALLEMAEYLKANGELKLAAACRETANRLCDYILWMKEGKRQ